MTLFAGHTCLVTLLLKQWQANQRSYKKQWQSPPMTYIFADESFLSSLMNKSVASTERVEPKDFQAELLSFPFFSSSSHQYRRGSLLCWEVSNGIYLYTVVIVVKCKH